MENLWSNTNSSDMTHRLKTYDKLILSECKGNFDEVRLKFFLLNVRNKVIKHKLETENVNKVFKERKCLKIDAKKVRIKCFNLSYVVLKNGFIQSLLALLTLLIAIYCEKWDQFIASRCVVTNNYLVMEVTRPIANCDICRNVDKVIILENVTKQSFAKYAYTGHPILVRGATINWLALNTFDFNFFRKIYSEVDDAYQSVEEECQFFPFRSEFYRLSEVFSMPDERVQMREPNVKPWYIGWSNCNPHIAQILRQHYKRPEFLPDDSESSAIDWIFMGYTHIGASMHLDYVQRPSWQAQISGSKTWNLLPPPECENECTAINISVHKGDIILIDTNQWYHDTHINPGEISVTIGSEYD